jgi:AcrR family transcriptional regulator
VLDAALASFGTKGYEATSLDQGAAELGVRKQTILYYYSTKPQLLDAVVDRSADELAGVLRGAVAGAGFGEAII